MERRPVRIEPWGSGDLALLVKVMGDPEMTTHLGGPESTDKINERQLRYERLADSGAGRMFKIVDDSTGEGMGSVGYWDRIWHGEPVYEMGWSVLPPFQGRGVGLAATAQAISAARSDGKHRYLHAFPSVQNKPSNGICRRLGFTLLGEFDFEYPPGHALRCNDWRLDLTGGA
ncbi:MAG: GNAT family N-acetyltransferase [Actinomycetota bacterium]